MVISVLCVVAAPALPVSEVCVPQCTGVTGGVCVSPLCNGHLNQLLLTSRHQSVTALTLMTSYQNFIIIFFSKLLLLKLKNKGVVHIQMAIPLTI